MVKASAKDHARFREAMTCMAKDDLTQLAEIFSDANASREH
jgi:hypothetical protein